MKKRFFFYLPLFSLLLSFLSGCSCQHIWISATCTSPTFCSKCGSVEGESIGHSWVDATCYTPRSCSRCGISEGAPLNHDWTVPSCVTPSSCSRCGISNGSILGDHVWVDATYDQAKHCSVCSIEEGLPLVDPTDIRYVLAACAYHAVLENTYVASSVIIERARFTPELEEIGYPTVFLECSAENSLGGRSLVCCYAYKVINQDEAANILPRGSYYTFTHYPNQNESYYVYCQTENMADDFQEVSSFDWEHLNADLILQRYKTSRGQ